jgi:hypothetical protein
MLVLLLLGVVDHVVGLADRLVADAGLCVRVVGHFRGLVWAVLLFLLLLLLLSVGSDAIVVVVLVRDDCGKAMKKPISDVKHKPTW